TGGPGAARTVVGPTGAAEFTVPLRAGRSYLIEPVDAPPVPYAPVTSAPATSARTLGPVEIGLPLTS
ncbi:MAG TPA: hypothetical protein VF892_13510, partial [Pseudonocardiaceae bacterium]